VRTDEHGATAARRAKVLVVDDEEQVRTVVCWQLESENFEVDEASDGDSAMRKIVTSAPDLVVLDLSLPGKGGLEVLAGVRRDGMLPVIVLTARRDEIERIVALDLGADDYVVKPFSPRELAARVRSVLRRSVRPSSEPSILEFGPLRMDLDARQVWLDGRAVALSRTVAQADVHQGEAAQRGLAVVVGVAARDDGDRARPPAAAEARGGSEQSTLGPHGAQRGLSLRPL
jgi:DNA-binding response OmpR family regulator